MRITPIIATPVLALVCVGFSIAPVNAAPNNGVDNAKGQVEKGPDHANSICSFSGLNDEPLDPVEGGRVQSFGQIVKVVGATALKQAGEFPGALCNAHNLPWQQVGGGGQ